MTSTHWQTDFFSKDFDDVNGRSMVILEKESSIDLAETIECRKLNSLLRADDGLSKKQVLQILQIAILNTAQSFKYSEKMTYMQSYVLAEDLLDKMKYESLEDVLLMLKMGRRGELGSNKGRFDSDVLFTLFLPAYNEIKSLQWDEKIRFEKLEREKKEKEDLAAPRDSNTDYVDQLHKAWKDSQKPKVLTTKSSVPENNDHVQFMFNLRMIVSSMTNSELRTEMIRAKNNKAFDAYEIYELELNSRK